MYEWQLNLLDKMTRYKGKGLIQITGRQTGKSILNNMFSGQALQRLMDDIMLRPIEDLVLSEGTVYGSRYYCVEPIGGNWRAMEDWCIENYGESSGSIWAEEVSKTTPMPNERWYANNRKFWFRTEQDRMIFVLKWR